MTRLFSVCLLLVFSFVLSPALGRPSQRHRHGAVVSDANGGGLGPDGADPALFGATGGFRGGQVGGFAADIAAGHVEQIGDGYGGLLGGVDGDVVGIPSSISGRS
ncbi:uncharacterized protein LOC122364906 [Amphibalanus amphitrite]|uniref:uncharacterized protein LOC122364906 n=1 Tax=Amphibalanus amphitrite TaxID=1232801 RepID=UPI001C92AB4C|nr:uncharacterized protein LOC122364906 [Amphibalanus amphitrite]